MELDYLGFFRMIKCDKLKLTIYFSQFLTEFFVTGFMEKSIVENLTQTLLNQLPKGKKSYSLSDLAALNLPAFLYKQITGKLFQEFSESLPYPQSEWADLTGETSEMNWIEFKDSAKKRLLLPASKSESVISSSVSDCLGLILRPYKTIPALLSKDSEVLRRENLAERSALVTINSYLAWALLRYMEKRDLDEISKEDAEALLKKIDVRLSSGYHPLNWLSVVKPLYELYGDQVEATLLQRFFEERTYYNYAKEFESSDKKISERTFIEILSSPGLIYVEGYGESQQSLFDQFSDNQVVEEKQEETVPAFTTTSESSEDVAGDEDEDQTESSDFNSLFLQKEEELDESEPDEEMYAGIEESDDEDFSRLEFSEEVENETEFPDQNEEEDLIESEPDDVEDPALKESDDEDFSLGVFSEENDEKPNPSDWIQEEGLYEPESDLESHDPELKKSDETEEHFSFTESAGFSPDDQEDLPDEEASEEWVLADTYSLDDEESLNENPKTEKDDSTDDDSLVDISGEEKEHEERPPWEDQESSEFTSTEDEDAENDEKDPTEDGSILSRFVFDESSSDNEDQFSFESADEVQSIYDEMRLSSDENDSNMRDLFSADIDEQEPVSDELDEPVSEPETEVSEEELAQVDYSEEDSVSDQSDDLPMWQSFLERDDPERDPPFLLDIDEKKEIQEEDEEAETDEYGYITEPIFDLTQPTPEPGELIEDVADWMADASDEFTREIFGGSETAYEEALAKIMEFNEWKQAARYIEREIFTRNRIDIYDEIAVDFTDRLHTFFIENRS